jgi:Fe-S-cluster containining protein
VAKKPLCTKCTAMCCRYVALPIENPKTRSDYDDIRWYLAHENVTVFVEKGDWYINFNSACRHIDRDHRCGIYENRPKICRKYTTNKCDITSDEYDYELHFTNDRQMQEYMNVKFDNMVVPNQSKKQKVKSKKKKTKR